MPLSRRKWILMGISAPLLVGAWWLFRPEKLWINQTVDEPAPFASGSESRPLYTGRLKGKLHETNGRATIYKTPNGDEYLRLTDFSTSNGPDVHVLLARNDDEQLRQETITDTLDSVELGSLKGNQGDQNYDLPAMVDLEKYNAVVIYCERFHAVFGTAPLEPF
jgi:electron transfer DM13